MVVKSCSVTVPGSAMLLGEHAVLTKNQAIVCAINKYLTLNAQFVATTNKIPKCIIDAPNFGHMSIDIDKLAISAPFTFVLQALINLAEKLTAKMRELNCDLYLTINAQFSATLGFGSSSAVSVATVAAICKLIGQKLSHAELFVQAYKVVYMVQKVGSGADVCASVYGGVVLYNRQTYQVELLPAIPSFYLIYAGYKTPTPEVIKHVQKYFSAQPQELEEIYEQINNLVLSGGQAIKNHDYVSLKAIFDKAYVLQKKLQVSDSVLDEIVTLVGGGAKISGSGLGDCVVAFDKITSNKYQSYPLEVSLQGVIYND